MPLDVTNYITKSYTYDDNNNLTESKISNNLPGQAASQRKVGYEYDNRNRLLKVNNYEASAIESYIQYEYDAVGNMTKQKTGNGAKITIYAYDNDNRLTSTTDPLNQIESYTYYSNNNLKTKTDRNGQTSTYTYDGAGKLLTTALVSPAGNITKANTYSKTGNLTQQSEQGAQISYQYDNLGRLTNVIDPDGITKTYTYNLNNQATNFQLKQNSVEKLNLTYSYDALDRLNTVKEGSTQIASYSYDQNGNQTSQTFNNGTTSNYTYNKANQILTLSNQKGAAVLSGYAYQYYTDGNAYKITDHNNVVTTYTYDGLGRLKSEAFGSSYSKTYNYDPSNNRSSMAVTGTGARAVSYDYDDNNRLTKETSVSTGITDEYRYVYDPNGNQIAKTKGSITTTGSGVGPTVGAFLLGGPTASGDYEAEVATYDGFNRLVQIKNNGQTIDYAYRPDDLRLSKTVNGVKTTHIWGGAYVKTPQMGVMGTSDVVMEIDGNGAVIDRYIYGINRIMSDNHGYYLYNGHNDVVQLASSSGVVTMNYQYDVFGNEAVTNPNGGMGSADSNPFRYAAEYFDSETASYYLRARNMSPSLGRFMSEDPIKDGTNWYIYCYNNPVLFVDSNGMKPYSVSTYDGNYRLFVSSQSMDATESGIGMIPAIGWGFSAGNWAGQRLAGFREVNYDMTKSLGIATGATGFITDNSMVKTVSRWAGRALIPVEVAKYANNWFRTHNYQIEEAVFNQFNRDIWTSSSRDLVDKKFEYAMKNMSYLILAGKIEVKKAIDVFGKDAFYKHGSLGRITYQLDPLTGKNRYYSEDDYYFFSLDDSMKGKIADYEKTIKQGVWLD